jgi:hypothetical protein
MAGALSTARHERVDRIDRSLTADMIEPTDATDPTENAESAEPIEAIERMDPTEPIERIEPLQPIHRIESSDLIDHRDPEPSGCASPGEPRRDDIMPPRVTHPVTVWPRSRSQGQLLQ